MPVGNPNKITRRTSFHIGFWLAALIVVLVLQYFHANSQKILTIPYSQFELLLQRGKIAKVRISHRYMQGTLKTPINGETEFETTN